MEEIKGLSTTEAQRRLKRYGFNEIKTKKKKSIILEFLREFQDFMIVILLIAVILAYFSGEKTDAIIIFAIVIVNAMIGFMQKYKAERAIEALQKLVTPNARIIRDGKQMLIQTKYLVPGDLIFLQEGDHVGADARVIDENELYAQESMLTGESVSVKKNESNIVFMGTNIAGGTGKGIVLNTGMNTQFGKIATLTVSTKKDKNPLEKELHKIGILAGKITLVISGILLFLGYFIQHKPFTETLLFAVGVAVAAVPEGLPATITIALAIGVQRMAKKNAIMKQLSSIETLGSTTVICSDKTGTLTKNEMTVKKIWTKDGLHEVNESKHDNNIQKKMSYELMLSIGVLCNNSKINKKRKEILGDPTEASLLTVASKAGIDIEKLQNERERIQELPFDSRRKMMTTIHRVGKKIYAYTKGAPDELIEKCSHILINGKIVKLDTKHRSEIALENEKMANKALRVMAFAYRELSPLHKKKYANEEVEKNLIFVGLQGIIDPPRIGVKEAILDTQKAGIKVYIITGDHGSTALAIAKEIQLIGEGEEIKIIQGEELDTFETKKLEKIFQTHKYLIFARVSPQHKLTIVNTLKSMGEIVAVTGDGVNDAPALKRADIGIAMGISGTDVSKEAANMVLADDSFATIVTAIKEGRTIYENLKKFIFYTFSCNIGELITVFSAIIIQLPAPLTAILILCINIGTDILPALALGIDPPENEIMLNAPRKPKTRIMQKKFITHVTIMGIIIGIMVTGLFMYILISNGWEWGKVLKNDDPIYLKGSTLAFVFLVLIQMVQAFNSRSLKNSLFSLGIFSNRYLLGAVTISILTLIALVHIPFFQHFLHTTSLSIKEWAIIGTLSLSLFLIEEVRKKIFHKTHAVFESKNNSQKSKK